MSGNSEDKARQLWTDYSTSRSLARLIAEVILLFKKDWQLKTTLYKGFQSEAEDIEKVWLSLLNSWSNPDVQIQFQMERLRRSYDDYSGISVRNNSVQIVPLQQIPDEKARRASLRQCSRDILSNNLEVADNVLWSASKLESVLQNSRLHRSRLLGCAPISVLTNPQLKMQWADSDIDSEGQMNNPYENEDSFSPLACRQRNTAQDDELGHVDPRKALQTTTFRSNGHSIHVFLESKDHDCCADDSSCSFVHKDLRSLAKKWHRLTLSRHSGVLELQSLVEPSAEKGRFAFVYRLPCSEAVDPPAMITLQELMGKFPAEDVPLQSRLRLTKRICSALATLHAGGILHKNITKSSIVYFGDRSDGHQCDSLPYLVNCDFSRPLGDHTSYQFNHKLVRNISQHPACQGVPNEVFTAEYDVYALGVLLLEIGLWSAAIDIFAARNEGVPPTKSTSPVKIQNRLILAAAMSLPDIMGPGFASLVVRCLSAGAEHLSLEAASELSSASISQAMEGIEEKSLRHNFTNRDLRS